MWPLIAKEYSKKDYDKVEFNDINHIVFTGMGGSGAIGSVISAILSKTNIFVDVTKGYHLTNLANSSTLVVATSASGNTLETMTILKAARRTGCKIIAFSSGGKMQQFCKKHEIEYRKIPILNSPRASFPAYLYGILNVLEETISVNQTDIKESIEYMMQTRKQVNSTNLTGNPSLELAEWLREIPIIYYPAGLQAVATRFKNSLQENAKTHAMAEDIVEACHNGIVSWEMPSIVHPILIEGKDDYVKTKQLWKIIKEYFLKNNIDYKEIHSVRGNILSKIINLIYLLDYASIYYAMLRRIDPTPVKSIEYVKKRMI